MYFRLIFIIHDSDVVCVGMNPTMGSVVVDVPFVPGLRFIYKPPLITTSSQQHTTHKEYESKAQLFCF